ncbi:hypothetical protein ES703_119777 [subsurface metagenome]
MCDLVDKWCLIEHGQYNCEIWDEIRRKIYINGIKLDDINLHITDSVYDFIVKKCVKKETGARGLKSYIMEYLEDACFKAYSEKKKNITIHLSVGKNKIITRVKSSS